MHLNHTCKGLSKHLIFYISPYICLELSENPYFLPGPLNGTELGIIFREAVGWCMSRITLVCIISPRRARTTEQGLMMVSKTHVCLGQDVRLRDLVWVWGKCVASEESGTSGRCRFTKGELIGSLSPYTPGPMSPLLHLRAHRQHPQSQSRVFTVTLLAQKTHQSTRSAEAFFFFLI